MKKKSKVILRETLNWRKKKKRIEDKIRQIKIMRVISVLRVDDYIYDGFYKGSCGSNE